MKRIVVILMVMALSACAAPAPTATSTVISTATWTLTIEPTATLTPVPTATVAPTATQIPVSEIDLEPILLLPGDLPAAYEGDQVKDALPSRGWNSVPKPANVIVQQFVFDKWASDGVRILLYETAAEAEEAFGQVVKIVGQDKDMKDVSGIGEKAMSQSEDTVGLDSSLDFIGLSNADVVFLRCIGVVHVGLFNTQTDLLETATIYAKRLDKRLTPLICR